MGKIERKYLAHYIDANIGGTFTSYVRLGKDLETYAEELNPQVSIQRNLGGQPFVNMEGYQVQSSVEPYYAEYGGLLFEVLSRIANNRITDDSCKTTKVDVLLNEDGTQVWAYREDCWIVPVSIGGDTSGVQIPFNVYCAGNRVYGTFDTANKTFAETGEEPAISPFMTLATRNNGVFNAPAGKGYSQVTVSVPTGPIELVGLSVNSNGIYTPSRGTAYNQVTVSVPGMQVLIERTVSGEIADGNVSVVGDGAFMMCSKLEAVSFPACTAIGSNAFYSCRKLRTVSLPECTTVGSTAFNSCGSLGEISLPKCTRIGYRAFESCAKLSQIYVPNCEYIEAEAFMGAAALTSVEVSKCTSINNYAFRRCTKLETLLADSCLSVGYMTFTNCVNLKSVRLPKCEYVGYEAFLGCSSLESIQLPCCSEIVAEAFRACYRLGLASFGSNMSSIGYSVFNSCYNLVSLYMMYSGVVSLSSDVSLTFSSTPLYDYSTSAGKWGTIYVPASLLTAYQEDSKWSVISSRFSGI